MGSYNGEQLNLICKYCQDKYFKAEQRSEIKSLLAFASIEADFAHLPGYGPYYFSPNGQIHHRADVPHTHNDQQRKFTQWYIFLPHETCAEQTTLNTSAILI